MSDCLQISWLFIVPVMGTSDSAQIKQSVVYFQHFAITNLCILDLDLGLHGSML
jgi:hypothetical protein